jgi:hypothetical protein
LSRRTPDGPAYRVVLTLTWPETRDRPAATATHFLGPYATAAIARGTATRERASYTRRDVTVETRVEESAGPWQPV